MKPIIIMPAAGSGNRFKTNGYTIPKYLLPIENEPMYVRALHSLGIDGDIIFIFNEEDYNNNSINPEKYFDARVITLAERTQGTAETVYKIKQYVDPTRPVVLLYTDQIVEYDVESWKQTWDYVDGSCLTFPTDGSPKWSFAVADGTNITQIVAKDPVSNHALTGIYYWKTAASMFKGIEMMIAANDKTNGEFYICPSINYLLRNELWEIFEVNSMNGVGTPEDYEKYIDDKNSYI